MALCVVADIQKRLNVTFLRDEGSVCVPRGTPKSQSCNLHEALVSFWECFGDLTQFGHSPERQGTLSASLFDITEVGSGVGLQFKQHATSNGKNSYNTQATSRGSKIAAMANISSRKTSRMKSRGEGLRISKIDLPRPYLRCQLRWGHKGSLVTPATSKPKAVLNWG